MQTVRANIYGDSLMKAIVVDEGFRYHSVIRGFLEKLRSTLGVETKNKARFGFTVDRGREALLKDLEKGLDCDYALLEFGGNDCDFDWAAISAAPDGRHEPKTPISRFVRTLEEMADDVLQAGATPVLMTLPPIDAERYFHFLGRRGNDLEAILHWLGDVQMIYRFQESYSNAIARLAAARELLLVDVRARFLDRCNYRSLAAADGIHLTEAGYALVYEEFRTFIAGRHAPAPA